MIEATCDGCGRKAQQRKEMGDWRSVVVDLGYPHTMPGYGVVDEIAEFLMCGECADLLGDFGKLKLAVKTALSREGEISNG